MTAASDVLASDSVHAIWLVQMDAILPCYLVKTFRECFEKNCSKHRREWCIRHDKDV